MTVIISGTDGVSDVDGSASTPAIRGTDANTGIFFPAADTIAFAEGGAEAMRIDSSGQLMLGTTTSTNTLSVDIQNVSATSNNVLVRIRNTNNNEDTGLIIDGNSSATQRQYTIGVNTQVNSPDLTFSGPTGYQWYVDGTERARITSGGYFKASNTGSYQDVNGAWHEFQGSNAASTIVIRNTASSSTRVLFLRTPNASLSGTDEYLLVGGATTDRIYIFNNGDVKNTNNSYGAISDEKLKQDIIDASSQWDDIKALRVVKYRLKSDVEADQNAKPMLGLVAQEVEEISAGLVTESPDYEEVEITDEEGKVTTERQATGTVTKSVKYSVLYMKAVKALQEAMERIETLEAKVAALEGAE